MDDDLFEPLSWLQELAVRVLRQGRIPRHVAVIMDGNRRYARQCHLATIRGHESGYDKLKQVIDWCNAVGVQELTVYAFSLENFKRTKEEVDSLLELAERKLRELLQDRVTLERRNSRFRFPGNLSYLPKSLQQVCAALTLATKECTKLDVNIALCYTSREEICTAIRDVVTAVGQGIIDEGDLSEETLSSAMYLCCSSNPDILLRTSGEARLSDFLLWQTVETVTSFVSCLWPEISIWHFLASILCYQWQATKIANYKNASHTTDKLRENITKNSDSMAQFKEFIHQRRFEQIKKSFEGDAVQLVWQSGTAV